jgi:hypothetical protein
VSKSAQYNEALGQPLPRQRCRHCRLVITTFSPSNCDGAAWWKHVTSGQIVCSADGALHIANPPKTYALSA